MGIVISARNVSKQYRLGQIGTGTLSHDLNRWWHRIRGHEDPYLRIGETDARSGSGDRDYVWALRDIDFDVNMGEVLGIIGRNGAGKSTLLKILSRTTSPTTGEIGIKGRIASLLEVGTGFHPELTGRENVFLNGTLLGMTKKEIASKFDEIVDFAGVEKFIDTPVKRYSSGMYVRLAFGVAAHLESEILIVDEVLAVGDMEFQKKCLGKMNTISSKEGRTVLFVSHNMGSMKSLCRNGIVMGGGQIRFNGDMSEAISRYLEESDASGSNAYVDCSGFRSDSLEMRSITMKNLSGEPSTTFLSNEEVVLEACYTLKGPIKNMRIIVSLQTGDGTAVFETSDVGLFDTSGRAAGEYMTRVTIPPNLLNAGRYLFEVIVDKPGEELVFGPIPMGFTISELMESQIGILMGNPKGVIHPKLKWEVVNQ